MINTKTTIFISHITEEAEIAKRLKEFIEIKFLNAVNVFVSSHEQSISLGDNWFSAIKDSISICELMIVVCSPISVARPWINFESGAGWVREIPVIPLCHSGLTPGRLPVPLNSLQAGMLNMQPDLQKLFDRIASVTGIASPRADDDSFFAQVKTFEADVRANLLLKDSTFIANLLHRQVSLLKYGIFASIRDYDSVNNMDPLSVNLESLEFTFNDVHRLFNFVLLSSSTQKVFQFIQSTVQQMGENIRFILSNKHVEIAPELEESLKDFLYAISIVDGWYETLARFDRQPEVADDFRKSMIQIIKNEPLPPTYKPSHLINTCIDYYKGLVFYKDWLVKYQRTIGRLAGNVAQAPQFHPITYKPES